MTTYHASLKVEVKTTGRASAVYNCCHCWPDNDHDFYDNHHDFYDNHHDFYDNRHDFRYDVMVFTMTVIVMVSNLSNDNLRISILWVKRREG